MCDKAVSVKAVTKQGVIVYSDGQEVDLEHLIAFAIDSIDSQSDHISKANLQAAISRLSNLDAE